MIGRVIGLLPLLFVWSVSFSQDGPTNAKAPSNDVDEPALPGVETATQVYAQGIDIRTLQTDIRNIEGLRTDINGTALDLTQTLSGLNAEVTDKEIVLNLASDVLFDFDQSAIKPDAIPTLEKVAMVIKESSTGQVMIIGHTDAKGSMAYNQTLSEQRAQVIYQWLSDKVQTKYVTKGLGETQPIADNTLANGQDNPEGRAQNRRVEIVIQTEK